MIKINYIEPQLEEKIAEDVYNFIKSRYGIKFVVAVQRGHSANKLTFPKKTENN